MDYNNILDDLIALLDAHGVHIRFELLDESSGGLCKINGKDVVFLDMNAEPEVQTKICSEAILKLIDIETVYFKPEIRDFLESVQSLRYSTISHLIH